VQSGCHTTTTYFTFNTPLFAHPCVSVRVRRRCADPLARALAQPCHM
jgi:hypothetical protein